MYGSLAYNYDAVGNRTSETENATSDTYAYVTTSNRLASISGSHSATYSYDGAGNILSDGTHTYTVNDMNRMQSAGGAVYVYNGRGERVAKTDKSIGSDSIEMHEILEGLDQAKLTPLIKIKGSVPFK